MKLTIKGEVPSKKNQRVFARHSKRGIVSLPSKRYMEWREDALWQLKKYEPITKYPVGVTMVIYPQTKRQFDLDNRATSVLDVLQDAGILENDNWAHVYTLTVEFGEIVKDAYCEVWIDE